MNRKARIPIAVPILGGREKQYVMECLESGWISSIGRFVGLFESQFAAFCGASHGVAANNGTTALHLALAALGVGAGDEVIVPTLTYIATANAVRYCGASPTFVDSEEETMTLDPNLVEAAVTARTKGIIAVHLYGHPVDMNPLRDIAQRYGLFLLEDAAEAHGALYEGRSVGSIGDAATFSFYGNKIISTGEGGMITTSDTALRDRMILLRGQGMDPVRRYWFPVIGFNYRMTNITAAIGLAQLEQVESFLAQRRKLADIYNDHFKDLREYLDLPCERPWARHAYWSYPIVLRESVEICRDELMQVLDDDGIETRPVFYPMHQLPPYEHSGGHYPAAERLARRGVCLPMHCALADEDISYIVERIRHRCRAAAAY